MSAALAFDRVACARGGRMLFEDVSFALGPGDALIVSGPNGVGKSSLLRLAAGLLDAAAGAIAQSGSRALADDHLALDTRLPLARALGFWARIDGGHVAAALDAAGLVPLAQVPVRMLSTGQRRRAILARTIASGADIWLLDEPANGLDAGGVTMLERLIADHRRRGGIVAIATHQPIAAPGAQRVVLG